MNRLSRLKEILWIISMFGLVAIITRLLGGLGGATDLSDSMPWGLWKILNMVAGVALSTGGFTLACIVYIFNIKKYKPVLKPAILIACLGYGASCFALFLDIGLPHTIWHAIIYWNHHSFLFEVAWCVMLYFTVTLIEVAPVVLEKYNYQWIIKILHSVSIPIVIIGITLSSLHHTSLGSLFLVMPARLHDLWFTTFLPVHFFLSAVGAGIMTVVFVTLAYSYFFNKKEDIPMLTGLAQISSVVLGIYFITKIADLAVRGKLSLIFAGTYESYFFILEMLTAVFIPVILVAIPSVRKTTGGLLAASGSAIIGLLINRMNVGIVGLLRTSDVSYFPSLAEISLSLGIISSACLVFIFMIENFKVFEFTQEKEHTLALGLDSHKRSFTKAWSQSFISDQATYIFIGGHIDTSCGRTFWNKNNLWNFTRTNSC